MSKEPQRTVCTECGIEFAVCLVKVNDQNLKPCHLCLAQLVTPEEYAKIMQFRSIGKFLEAEKEGVS